MRLHTLFLAAALAAASSMAAETQGQPSGATTPDAKAGKAATACIDTEVNGYRALSYECLNQKMAPEAAPKPPPTLESEAITHRPPNQMGLPTPATIGNRMGNTFGTSAYPQRPSP
ncbi:hypothetical protein KDH83_03390 [Achromobacter sp. Marseille-Q0513]|uniref:hypothetical protein n=1 Tax=Achromobacter sp. Marseille-Q0513 TaxID=2829161 RepID=UPI001B9DB5DB|nr:hypothetical protein [Achromobacter sp. Marseille-Q0513]MBR8652349.1 hypothetical protein [Achromobacter sp. Marseille-Q0513]